MISLISALLIGTMAWTLAEYVIHRWLGHHRRWVRATPFGREHTLHHSRGDYFAPTYYKVAIALIIVPLLAAAIALLFAASIAWAFAGGFAVTYLAYEWHHRRLHTHAPRGTYGRWARRHHFFHHFHDPTKNHGVTSPVWDYCFGTHAAAAVVVVPQKLAMPWLLDESGAPRPEWSGLYVVRPSSAQARPRPLPAAPDAPANVSAARSAGAR